MNKILLVDDEEEILEVLRRVLEDEGYSVMTTSNPLEVINVLRKETIDLAMLDLKMPEMDGIELLERIKREFQDIKVIIMTGNATVKTAVEALKKGASDYLMKPLEMDDILQVVAESMGKVLSKNNMLLKD